VPSQGKICWKMERVAFCRFFFFFFGFFGELGKAELISHFNEIQPGNQKCRIIALGHLL
jgi:hypothetical protein